MDNADLVDGTAIGQQADMVRMSVDVSCSDAPQVLVRTHDGCRRCAGNTKERHTCGKRRAPPQGVAAASRPSRQRTGKTDESRSATVILLPTESTIDMADNSPPALLSFEVNMPGQQQIETVSERPDASREEDDDDVTLESNEERLDALGESNAMSVEGGEDDSDVVLQLNEESRDGSYIALEGSASAAAELGVSSPGSFVFAQLVSAVPVRATPDATDYELMFTVEGADGTQVAMDKSSVSTFPLKASGEEEAWSCNFCSAKGWSVARTLCCVQCGQPAPMDEAHAASLMQAKRAEMARQRPSRLGGRRIVMEKPPFRSTVRASQAYQLDEEQGVGGVATSQAGRNIEAEVNEQAAQDSAWHARRFDSALFVDSAVSMLTLGHQGLSRKELREKLQPEAIATVFILMPRLVEVERGVAVESSSETAAMQIEEVTEDTELEAAALLKEAMEAACSRGGEPCVSVVETRSPTAASEPTIISGASVDGTVLPAPPAEHQTDRDIAEPIDSCRSHRVPVIPRVKAHWQALGELDGSAAAAFAELLCSVCRARQEYVSLVLDKYGVAEEYRERNNLLCGLSGISCFTATGDETDGQRCWTVNNESFDSAASALLAASVECCVPFSSEEVGEEVMTAWRGDVDAVSVESSGDLVSTVDAMRDPRVALEALTAELLAATPQACRSDADATSSTAVVTPDTGSNEPLHLDQCSAAKAKRPRRTLPPTSQAS